MKLTSSLCRRLHWVNLPGALLIAVLQRTPVLRVAPAVGEMVVASPVGALLRSAAATAAALGAIHSLAGATTMVSSTESPLALTVGTPVSPVVAFGTSGTATQPDSWTIGGSIPPGLSFSGLMAPGVVNVTDFQPLLLFGTPTTAGSFTVTLRAHEGSGGTLTQSPLYTYQINVSAVTAVAPTISIHPSSQTVFADASIILSVGASGTPAPTYQWQQNGSNLAGATSASLILNNVQPAQVGAYRVVVTNSAGSVTSDSAIVGIRSSLKLIGAGLEFPDIDHPNGNRFDQILLQGPAATVHADAGQILRMSYIDLNDDIVQVEFAGAGALSLVLDSASGPAIPVKYNQAVEYWKGHATIVVTDADETTNLSVFSVGRLNAFDPTGGFNFLQAPSAANDPLNNGSSLFVGHPVSDYDGLADIAFLSIASTDGKFAGLRTANTSYFSTKGLTGVHAPGVQFLNAFFVGNVNAFDAATPVLLIGSGANTLITGGNLRQENGSAVQVSGFTQLKFQAGSKSHGQLLPAQANQGVLLQNGVNVTGTIVVNPGP